MSYEIVRYDPRFKPQVLELKGDQQPPPETRAAHFEWAYERNPYLESPLIYLAFHGEQLVGMRCLFGTKWQIGDKSDCLIVPCNADTFILPEHRTRGVFQKMTSFMLADLAEQSYSYIFNLSAGSATHINSLLMGWRSVCGLEMMERGGRLSRQIRQLRQFVSKRPRLRTTARYLKARIPHGLATQQERPWKTAVSAHKELTPTGGLLSVETLPRPSQMADLLERRVYGGRIRHVRDKQYFEWRYLNPRFSYRFVFWEKDQLDGYLVLQTTSDSLFASVNIVDWEGKTAVVENELLKGILKRLRFRRLITWTATLPEETKSILRSVGFQMVRESNNAKRTGPSLLVRRIDTPLPAADWRAGRLPLLEPSSWDLRMIDAND